MAYPPSSNFPSQQQAQYPQSLQNTYQPDHYPQDFTQQGQDLFSQQNSYSQTSFTQQNTYPQDSFSQSLQTLSDQQSSYPQQSSSYSQSGQIHQQRPSQTHVGQTPRQQFPQQTQHPHTQFTQPSLQGPYISQSQQLQQPFSQNQYPQTNSALDQSSFAQQNSQPSSYPQPAQAQADRTDQRNSPLQQNLYNLQGQATQPNLPSQHNSHSQPNHFSNPSAQFQANGFPQSTQQGQQPFSQIQPPQLNQPSLQQNNFNGQTVQAPGPPFHTQSNQQMQRSQSLPHTPQSQQAQQHHLAGDAAGVYQLFFTGRDDPRCCMLIGEDTKPVYLSFETQESNLNQTVRTMVGTCHTRSTESLNRLVNIDAQITFSRFIKTREIFVQNWSGVQVDSLVMPRLVTDESLWRL
jgi:hypothetical protein